MSAKSMTKKELAATYPDQWVVVECVKTDRHGMLVAGPVLAHGTDKVAVQAEWGRLLDAGKTMYIYYTGPIDHDVLDLFL